MAKTNAAYWAERMKQMEDALQNQAYDYVQNMEHQFAIAQAEIEKEIAVWYQRLAANNGVSLAEAKKMLDSGQLKEFQWTVQEYIKHGEENALSQQWMKELENASARVHISKLDALKIQLQQQAELLHGKQLEMVNGVARDMYVDSYFHTAFELQRGIGVGVRMPGINQNALDKILARPWTQDGKTFSDHIWGNKENLVNSINTQLTQMIIRGESPQAAIDAIASQFNVSKRKAGRLIMTESAFFASAAQKDCYNDLEVEHYQIVATLDHSTCETCGAMDSQVFKMSDYEVGITAPPFHPWCRCCTCPYYEDMAGLGERWARDAVSGESYKVPRDMTYEQWKAKQDSLHGAGTVDLERKKQYNYTADREQWSRYRPVLRELAPASFEDFQKLKYENPAGWKQAKARYRILNSYKIDSGNMSAKEILKLDSITISEKRTQFSSGFKKSGNIASAYIDGNLRHMYFAHSALSDTRKGYNGSGDLVILKDNRRFAYIDVPKASGKMRVETWHDSEAKLFEYFADLYDKKPFHSINMLSERGMCDSCKGVMEQFKKLYPGVQINVVSNKKVIGDVWKHRRRK